MITRELPSSPLMSTLNQRLSWPRRCRESRGTARQQQALAGITRSSVITVERGMAVRFENEAEFREFLERGAVELVR
jgi:hypothetical protein